MAEHPERPRDLQAIKNTQERQAHLIVDMQEDRAQRMVDVMDEPPPGMEEPDAERVREMWSFSPFRERAARVFWQIHDAALAKKLADISLSGATGDDRLKAIRDAYNTAEMAALGRVYPHRATLMMLGITTPERSVELAEKAARLVEQDRKRQRPEQVQEATAY